jgi:hypothetical protein
VVIATSSSSEYREDAIAAARKELLVRGESWQNEQIVAEARKVVEAEAKDPNRNWGSVMKAVLVFVPFLVPLAFVIEDPKEAMKGLKFAGIGCLAWLILLAFLIRFGFY